VKLHIKANLAGLRVYHRFNATGEPAQQSLFLLPMICVFFLVGTPLSFNIISPFCAHKNHIALLENLRNVAPKRI
jgi:hypothetical protein